MLRAGAAGAAGAALAGVALARNAVRLFPSAAGGSELSGDAKISVFGRVTRVKIVNTGEVTSMSLRGGDGSLFFFDKTAVIKTTSPYTRLPKSRAGGQGQ